ncbi:hypothetical protein A4A49_53086, partial [Nicotiana attenuata]
LEIFLHNFCYSISSSVILVLPHIVSCLSCSCSRLSLWFRNLIDWYIDLFGHFFFVLCFGIDLHMSYCCTTFSSGTFFPFGSNLLWLLVVHHYVR